MARTQRIADPAGATVIEHAAGLHLWGTPRTYMFDQWTSEGMQVPYIVIGNPRGRKKKEDLHIPIKHDAVSEIHAIIEWKDRDRFTIGDSGSTNGTWIDDEELIDECPLLVGMNLYLGRVVRLIAVDRTGNPIINAHDVGELSWLLYEMYGSWTEAERRTDVKREFLRAHAAKFRKGPVPE